jgi:hypothetical protein
MSCERLGESRAVRLPVTMRPVTSVRPVKGTAPVPDAIALPKVSVVVASEAVGTPTTRSNPRRETTAL